MIQRIWEDTLGKIHTQDDWREGTNDDIPFEFKYPDNPTTAKMEIGFSPLDLLAFLGYSYELLEAF